MDSVSNRHWYLLYSKARSEEIARKNLEDQNYQVFLPRHRLRKRIRGRYQDVIEPLFPRYLFIRLGSGVDDWGPIRSTPGVANMVRFGKHAARIPENLISYLKQRQLVELNRETVSIGAKQGDRVRVLNGPMRDYEGIFQANSGQERVLLLMEIAGKWAKVSLPMHSVAVLE